MSEAKAAPRPWNFDKGKDGIPVIYDGTGQMIGFCQVSINKNSDENAELIVRAVNAYDDLMAHLKTCTDELAEWVGNHYVSLHHNPVTKESYERDIAPVRAARAALAKAGE